MTNLALVVYRVTTAPCGITPSLCSWMDVIIFIYFRRWTGFCSVSGRSHILRHASHILRKGLTQVQDSRAQVKAQPRSCHFTCGCDWSERKSAEDQTCCRSAQEPWSHCASCHPMKWVNVSWQMLKLLKHFNLLSWGKQSFEIEALCIVMKHYPYYLC